MSNTGAKQDLLRDIEAYTCGLTPSAVSLLRAPTIQNWTTEIRRIGKEFKMVVAGQVIRHPEFLDGEQIYTSAVQWFDRKCRFVRTFNRIYALGEQLGDEISIDGVDV
jgi:hypothetical protein